MDPQAPAGLKPFTLSSMETVASWSQLAPKADPGVASLWAPPKEAANTPAGHRMLCSIHHPGPRNSGSCHGHLPSQPRLPEASP